MPAQLRFRPVTVNAFPMAFPIFVHSGRPPFGSPHHLWLLTIINDNRQLFVFLDSRRGRETPGFVRYLERKVAASKPRIKPDQLRFDPRGALLAVPKWDYIDERWGIGR